MPTVQPSKYNKSLLTDHGERRFGFRRPSLSTERPEGPAEGDTFWELDTDTMWVWNGTAWIPLNSPIFNKASAAGAGSTSSNAFSDFPGPIDLPFTKYSTSTSLAVWGTHTNYATAGTPLTAYSLLINGVDYSLGDFFFNQTGVHTTIGMGVKIATGLAAGSYTARLRWRIVSAGTINADANDVANFFIQETVQVIMESIG